jgi:hypothetical protein
MEEMVPTRDDIKAALNVFMPTLVSLMRRVGEARREKSGWQYRYVAEVDGARIQP